MVAHRDIPDISAGYKPPDLRPALIGWRRITVAVVVDDKEYLLASAVPVKRKRHHTVREFRADIAHPAFGKRDLICPVRKNRTAYFFGRYHLVKLLGNPAVVFGKVVCAAGFDFRSVRKNQTEAHRLSVKNIRGILPVKVRPTAYPAVIEQPAQPPVKDIVSVKRADNPAELMIIAASVIPYLSADIIFYMNSVFRPASLRNTGLSRCAAFCQLKAAEIHRNTSFESAGARPPAPRHKPE